jgi:hypothetical protein
MNRSKPPATDELELSLFGAGIGECIVLHLGGGEWMVVDSCLNENRDHSIAIDYLEQMQVDIARQVKLVVVSHWHDDHIQGISEVVLRAKSSKFACSTALQNKEFFALVSANDQIKLVELHSGISEFSDVMEVLQSRSSRKYKVGPDIWAVEGTVLYSGNGPNPVEVHALSPSHQVKTDSFSNIARLIPSAGDSIGKIPYVTPNALSVALIVKSPIGNILLGADLEQGKDQRHGWQALIASSIRPKVLSHAYKVAHHGSDNADLDDIWQKLLIPSPIALLTPFVRGKTPRPSETDIQRLKSKTDKLYCTIWPLTTHSPRRRGVDGIMNHFSRNRRAQKTAPGHIRLRMHFTEKAKLLSCDLFDGAKQL